ncbi:MAG TPA: hypothetical protein VH143_32895 [Kofleriaceae bacterium]|nr:hypothetical protein [Kofleriaceae bacterium]
MTAPVAIDSIEPAITKLVHDAPARDAETVRDLGDALRSVGSPLALSIARILEYVDDDLVDPGIALPAIAEACAALVDGVKHGVDPRALEAARYRIDTLEPRPDGPAISALASVPDVPASDLIRGPRRRT